MLKKRLAVLACALALAAGLVPCLAYAGTGELSVGGAQLQAQAVKDLGDCTLKWTGNNFKATDTEAVVFYVSGAKAAAKPTFELYYKGKLVPSSEYTVKYQAAYWDEEKGEDAWKNVSASKLYPKNDGQYRIVATAVAGGSYTGTFEDDFEKGCFNVQDRLVIGRNTGMYFSKADSSWLYNVNPMQMENYVVIPQDKVKATLNSLTIMTDCSWKAGGVNHDGKKLASKYYTVSYYKAKKEMPDTFSDARIGKKLSKMPTEPGSYQVVVTGKSPYSGEKALYIDIQGSMDDVTVGTISKKTENGKYIEPGVKVTYKGETLVEGVDYEIAYKNNLKAGTATATITGTKVLNNVDGIEDTVDKARYFTGSKKVTFTIAKNAKKTWKANTVTASSKKTTVKSRQGGPWNKTFDVATLFSVKGAKGKVTYEKVSGPSNIEVAKSGTITVSSPAYPGNTYKAKVRVLAAGTSKYYAGAKIVTLSVTIK